MRQTRGGWGETGRQRPLSEVARVLFLIRPHYTI